MALKQPIIIQPRPNVKQINYLSKTFTDFRQNLIEFARAYFPKTYADFNESSPGMMFIEMASYVGDVLSFYIDNQFKENLLQYAEQPANIINIAQFLGYKPRIVSPATTTATLYQIVPALGADQNYEPDPTYLLKVDKGSMFSSTGGRPVKFRSTALVDFSDPVDREVTIYTTSGGNPTNWLVSKKINLIAAEEKTLSVSFGSPEKFSTITLPDEPIIGVLEVTDSDSNQWVEVDYLAQDVIFDEYDVSPNGETGILPSSTLRIKKVPRRFITRVSPDLRVELVFGSGINNLTDEEVTLDSRQIATSQYGSLYESAVGNVAINNVNFLNSTAFGAAPANTTLTVKYLVGGGTDSNVPSNTIVTVNQALILNDTTGLSPAELSIFNTAINSLAINNELPALGGGDGESLEEIKQNALAYFNAQNRVVTAQDYAVRAYSLPSQFGYVAKAYAVRDEQLNKILTQTSDEVTYVNNPVKPNAINLYVLGIDSNSKLSTLNTKVKENLARYLEQYRILTDEVNILDAFIINIAVQFDIAVFKNYNVNDVLARCIDTVNQFFAIEKWNINQPIILADLYQAMGSVDGVQTVKNITIINRYRYQDGSDYQEYKYDITDATVNGIIYPSIDASVFEIKYPERDIIGSATQ